MNKRKNKSEFKISYISGIGSSHPVHDYIQRTRDIFLGIGFDEMENYFLIPEEDVYKQYGEEAPVILDRVYYLATLPRPDIGISKEQAEAVQAVKDGLDITVLQRIFRKYREANIDSDELMEEISKSLELSRDRAIRVLNIFPEFKDIEPQPSKLTLRSHMTAAWYPTLAAIQHRRENPIKLFSIGPRFRREQRLDATHLKVHFGASCVLLDDEIDMEAGKELVSKILKELGFEDVDFVEKTAASNYYSKEYEIFDGKTEIADWGLYSKRSLENYGIEGDVFNLGFGIERIIMALEGFEDIRELVYPQFYGAWDLNDEEIAASIRPKLMPDTGFGSKLSERIVTQALENADTKAPCKIKIYDGKLTKKNGGLEEEGNNNGESYSLKVFLIEEEEGTSLCGPAYQNYVVVKGGEVYGVPLSDKYNDIIEGSNKTEYRYIDAFALGIASKVESLIRKGEEGKFKYQVKMVKNLGDINLQMGGHAKRYIMSQSKKIDIRGPMFTGVAVMIERPGNDSGKKDDDASGKKEGNQGKKKEEENKKGKLTKGK